MAYRLEKNEPVPDGIRRIVLEELRSAAEGLGGKADLSREQAIHEARKSVKKVRAVLRLLSGELGKTARKENARLRTAARKLSALRDLDAMLEIVEGLRKHVEAGRAATALDAVRKALEARRRASETDADTTRVLAKTAAALDKAALGVPAWPLERDGFPALLKGLKTTYRNGRKAFSAAKDDPTDLNYHEWRKRVKDHWYHLRLLHELAGPKLHERETRFAELSEWLGDDHNLAVLRGLLAGESGAYATKTQADAVQKLAVRRQAELRRQADPAGAELYAAKPRAFTAELERALDGAAARAENAPAKKAPGAKAKRRKRAAAPVSRS